MNQIAFFSLLSFFSFVQTCGQSNQQVVKAYGYFMVPTPGTIAVDNNGRPLHASRDTVFTVYVETKSKTITWESAWKDNRSFSVEAARVTEKESAGQTKKDNEKVEFSPNKTLTLWRIVLLDDHQKTKAPPSTNLHAIIIKAKSTGQPFYLKINNLTELLSPEYQ